MTKEEIQDRIDEENSILCQEAKEEFTRKTGAELKANCRRLTEETAERYALIMKGEAPRAFGAYDRDEIARILNVDTTICCDGYGLNTSLEIRPEDDWEDCAIETSFIIDAAETWDRKAFIEAYEKYLHTAAAFAKSIGSTHAMRLYLRAWGLVRKTYLQYDRLPLAADEALRTVNLERVATDRLWVDVEAMKLPAFRPRKAARPGRNAVKKRKGKD